MKYYHSLAHLNRVEMELHKLRDAIADDTAVPEPEDTKGIDPMKMFSQRYRVEQALKLSQGNRRKAAKLLGISERSVLRKIKQYKLKSTENESKMY